MLFLDEETIEVGQNRYRNDQNRGKINGLFPVNVEQL